MTGIEFGELPQRHGGGIRTGIASEIADTLRARPKEWAKVRTFADNKKAANFTGAVKQGRFNSMPKGEFEATQFGPDVWARYIGGTDS